MMRRRQLGGLYGTEKEEARNVGQARWRALVWETTERLLTRGLHVRLPFSEYERHEMIVQSSPEETRYGYSVTVRLAWTETGYRIAVSGPRTGESNLGWTVIAKATPGLLVEKIVMALNRVLGKRREEEDRTRSRRDGEHMRDLARQKAEAFLGFPMGRGQSWDEGRMTRVHPFEEITAIPNDDGEIVFRVTLVGALTLNQVRALKAIVEATSSVVEPYAPMELSHPDERTR